MKQELNIQNTAHAQGKVIKDLFVIAEFLTNNKTHAEQIYSLRRFERIFIDEVFQVNKEDIKKYTKLKLNLIRKYLLLVPMIRVRQLILTTIIMI